MTSLVTVLRATEGLLGALETIQRRDAASGNNRTENIKQKVSHTYGIATGFMSETELCWNWGLHRDDVQQDLRSKLDGFGLGESDEYSEQLYFYAFRSAQREARRPRRVLEVGCGTGRGLNLLSRLEEESSFVGLDLSGEAISLANAQFSKGEALKYVQGDAEALPFADGEFDVVLNVESSHNYPNLEKFFAEALRVLKPGGYLVHADLMTPTFRTTLSRIRSDLKQSVEWLVDEDISELVRAAIRRRMAPGSYFRREVRRNFAMPSRLLLEPLMMNTYGYVFLRENYGLISTALRARFKRVLPIETYRLTVARRSDRAGDRARSR